MLTWLVVTMIGLLASAAFGAWPLVTCRRLAPVWKGSVGLACIGAGVLTFASVCSATAWADSADAKAGEPVAAAESADVADSADANPENSKTAAEAKPADEAGSARSSSSEDAERQDVPADDSASSASTAGQHKESNPEVQGDDSIEITVPPEGVVIPHGRPSWVESPPMHVGEVHTSAVSSGPFARIQDCWHALDQELVKATDEYINEHLGQSYASQFINYDAKTIRTRFLKPENIYHEQIVVSIGPMHQVHALLEFKPEFRSELDGRWAQFTRFSRLTQVGLGAFAVLALLGVVFGYFRLDNATRGYYTGRLQFLTAAAILAIVGVGVVAARWVVWM